VKHALDIAPPVASALAERRPVVALESSLIAHGLPRPRNLEVAHALEATVAAAGAIPATIAVRGGRVRIGCGAGDLEHLVQAEDIAKVSRANLATVLAAGGDGATTVAGTMICAAAAGIGVLATGGIGGVHRGAADTFDISADLSEFARTNVAVVCSGAKSVLDLPKTLEVLEMLGVPVIGLGTDRFPAFHARDSGLALETALEGPAAVATVLRQRAALGLPGGVVVANPIPEAQAIEPAELERWIERAHAEAAERAVSGAALTPFLLDRLARLSDGRTVEANVALVEHNAAAAAHIAVALSETN
jgi:pseudouridine-5'-phosphate glycosidase